MIHLPTENTPKLVQSRNKVYLPFVSFGLSKQEQLLNYIKLGKQNRADFIEAESLMKGAQFKAELMATTNKFGHYIDGHWPNQLASSFGCTHSYQVLGNQIESIAAGSDDAKAIYEALLNSPQHKDHILGNGFFAEQTNVGVGFAYNKNSTYQYYWVFWSADCN